MTRATPHKRNTELTILVSEKESSNIELIKY